MVDYSQMSDADLAKMAGVPLPSDYAALEAKHGLPSGLLNAVATTESGGDPNAVSPAGAVGKFQFMPDTAKAYGIDPKDPQQAADGAARMFADLSKKYNGDVPKMLAGYNWGSGNLDKNGLAAMPTETRNYIKKVTGMLHGTGEFSGNTTDPATGKIYYGGQYIADTGQPPKQYADAETTMTDVPQQNGIDYSKMSDEDLMKFAGITSSNTPAATPRTTSNGLVNFGLGYGKGSRDLVGGVTQALADVGGAIAPETFAPLREDLAMGQRIADKRYDQQTHGSTMSAIGSAITPIASAVALPAGMMMKGVAGVAKGAGIMGAEGYGFGATAPSEVSQSPEDALAARNKGGERGAALSIATGGLLSGVGAGLNKMSSNNVAEQAARQGIDLPAGAATGSRTIQGAESAASNFPLADSRIQGAYQKVIDQMDSAVGNAADTLAPAGNATKAGVAVQSGIGDFVDRFKNKASALYDKSAAHFKPTEVVDVSNTQKVLGDVATKFNSPEFKKVFAEPRMAKVVDLFNGATSEAAPSATGILDASGNQIMKSAAPTGVSFLDLNNARKAVGQAISGAGNLIEAAPMGELKRLYGAMSQDITALAQQKGGSALRDVTRANQFYRAGSERIDTFLNNISQKAEPERIVSDLLNSKDGVTKLQAVTRSLQPEERNILRSQVIRELGRASPGMQDASGALFSPSTFLTNYAKLQKSGADGVLIQDAGVRSSLRDIADIAGNLKAGQKIINHSNTARNVIGGATLMAPYSVVPAIVGAVGTSRLLTNPSFARWLSTGAKITDAGNLAGHIAKLGALAVRNPEIGPDVRDYVKNLRGDHIKAAEQSSPAISPMQVPTQDDINMLRGDPKKLAPHFDEVYGQGAAQNALKKN